MSSNVVAQNNKQAKAEYDKALKAIQKKDVTKGLELYLSCMKKELDDPNPDHAFLGKLLDELGAFYSSPTYFNYGAQYYLYAAVQYHKAGLIEKSKNSLYFASILSDSIKAHDEQIEIKDEEGSFTSIDFSVKSVSKTVGDTTWFILDAGANQGITANQQGWILTRYEKNTDRGNNIYGRCGIEKVMNTYSVGWVAISDEAKALGLKIIENDNVQLNVLVPSSTYQGLLYELAKLNIYLCDDYVKPYANFNQLIGFDKQSYEDMIISVMRHTIEQTAKSLYDPKTTSEKEYPKLAEGMFAGQNMWEAMLTCTDDDIRAFLRFVVSFPAKYMGHNYRVDETFATWVINFTPLADDETLNLTNAYLDLKTDEEKNEWIEKNFRLIRSGGLNYGEIETHIYEVMNDSNYVQVDSDAKRIISLAKRLKNDSLVNAYTLILGQNLSAQEKYDDAINLFTEVLAIDTNNANAHWFRGHAYLNNDEFKRALGEYEKIMELYPTWAGGHAMYGWALIRSGRFKHAFEHCKKGYELDSFEAPYIMNMGHAYLLNNEPGRARYYYLRALDYIKATASFDKGLLEDFAIFTKNYWQTDLVKKERDFLMNEWQNHYKSKVLAEEHFEKGKKLEKKESYAMAGKEFDQAIEYEKKGSTVRYDWLRSYNRWAAYQYYKSEDYETALKRYQMGWEVNRNFLNNLEDEISDLESIGNLYSWLDNDLQKDMYRKMQQAAQRKLQTQTRSNNLYVISIGNNKHGNFGYNYAESDAKSIAETIEKQGKLVFDQSDIAIFEGTNATENSIQHAFEKVISNARPGDCFVLYYSGYCKKGGNDEMIFGTDTIRNDQLLGWLKLMQADKKVILMDAANTSLITEYAKHQDDNNVLYSHENLTFILSDGRIELPNEKSGLFTSFLIQGLNGEAAVNWGSTYQLETKNITSNLAYISAKGLEGYMYGKMNKGNMQFELKSYSQGADFPISFTTNKSMIGNDTVPPMIYISGSVSGEGKRGAQSKTVTSKGDLYGQALDASGISEITVNGETIKFTQNGKFELKESYVKRWTKIIVKAKDQNGIVGIDSFFLNTAQGDGSPGKGPGEDENIEGVNYALLFATNEYDNWSQLNNPINDARAIGEILEREYGFKVQVIENKTRQEMRNILFEYFAKNYSPKDQLFVFFAGHGVHNTYLGGQIVCKDSKKVSDDPTFDTYLSFDWVKSSLNNVYRCQHVMLTLDVCYGGAGFNQKNALYYGNSAEDIRKDPQGFFDQRMKYKTRLYLTSGDSTYVSDGRGNHSPFAVKFIYTLNTKGQDKGGILTLTDFANNMRFTEQGRQEIRYGSFGDSHIEGDFVFMFKGEALKRNSSNVSASSGM